MPARITQSMLSRNALANVTNQRLRLAETQRQASSGLRIGRPSDDPSGASAAQVLKTGLAATNQFQRNASQGLGRVAVAETAVAGAVDTLIRARELAVAGGTDTQDATSRRSLATEVASLHASLVADANTRSSRGHVFAGYSADVQPFVPSGPFVSPPPAAPTVAYAGDSQETRIAIDEGVSVRVGFDGRRIFLGDADGDGNPDAGREDLFDVLSDLWTALENDDPVATRQVLDRIDVGLDQLAEARTEMGASQKTLEDWQSRLDQRAVDLETRLSELQDADLADVVSRLVQQENALQAGLAAMARTVTPTLLDFLS